ncbi:MAG: DUF4124 domain-containing protein [Candidatus Dadabacteria bacterium]|nr:DUF4124 domain-containing protein [Candidatus Dadabacteria bacterium]NIS08406.1 DUF4124 domain-containing protein [Candidatus Dadabacteria bacterium]NIV41325.1 DUF4124 domain-containing protein [Candidatus Dadabacteria bacterium]NIY22395.1 DUF4124 domain-containing protein [Candidatus Dadabacteria bacterium]
MFFYFLSGTSAQAQVYKCVDSDGKTLYSNAPCPENTEEQSYKLKESYTINDEITEQQDELTPETDPTSQSLSSGELDINIVQVRI